MANLIATLNMDVLKLPLGFIRVVEFPMAILAFAATSGYDASGFISLEKEHPCDRKTYPIKFEYSFNMGGTELPSNLCAKNNTELGATLFEQGYSSSAQFFVFTGVISFLYVLGILAVYLRLWSNYENDPKFAMIDFAATAVLALFWFAGSCAWASGVSGLKTITSPDAINKVLAKVDPCKKLTTPCTLNADWNYASLNVSLIAGFACAALFIANLWFIYKETIWFKNRVAQTGPQSAATGVSGQTHGPGSQPSYR